MKSKFTPVAKVRKQQRDLVETRLAKARFEKKEIEAKYISTCKEIDDTKMPMSGSISLMSMVRESLAIMRRGKDTLRVELQVKDSEVQELQQQYKQAHMEFEKIKYLEEQDFEAYLEKIKSDEKLEMDEISNILFTNKGRN